MGDGDFMPVGGAHKKRYDPKHAAQIKKGAKKADQIRKTASEHHKKIDLPAAEEALKELEKINFKF